MLAALKNSPEEPQLVKIAVAYLRGVKRRIVQTKKKQQEKIAAQQSGAVANVPEPRGGTKMGKVVPPSMYTSGQAASVYQKGPPQRELTAWANDMGPGGMQLSAAEQQRMLQMQAHELLVEHEMENALRTFLDH